MAVEIFANSPSTTVTSGGTDAPAAGTQESWTVANAASFPSASSSATPPTWFHVADTNLPSELVTVINTSGTSWTVLRGAEGTTPVTHTVGFTIYQVVSAGALAQLSVVDWLNVTSMFGADPTDTSDSTTDINAAFSASPTGGGHFYFPRGTFKVSGALSVPTGAVIQGAGEDACIISQTSTTADTLSATDQRYITVRDIQLSGPSSGTGRGIAFLHSSQAVAGINLENVIVQDFGGDGIHLETVITSALTKVRSQSNGGHGFFANNGTSLSLKACYSNANASNGYELDAMNYMQLDSCAADSNTIGYSVNGSSAVVLNACGSESCTDGYKVLGASANIVLQGCKVIGETGIGFWITGSSTFCFLLGCREATPGVGATASFQVDSGSAAIVVDPQNTTGNNYSAGTVCLFQPTNLEIHSSGSAVARVSRGGTASTADYKVQTANSDRWSWGFNPSADATDDMYLSDIGHVTTLLHAAYQATAPNLGIFAKPSNYGGGVGNIFIANASTIPTSAPTSGAFFYVNAGQLYCMGTSGTAVKLST